MPKPSVISASCRREASSQGWRGCSSTWPCAGTPACTRSSRRCGSALRGRCSVAGKRWSCRASAGIWRPASSSGRVPAPGRYSSTRSMAGCVSSSTAGSGSGAMSSAIQVGRSVPTRKVGASPRAKGSAGCACSTSSARTGLSPSGRAAQLRIAVISVWPMAAQTAAVASQQPASQANRFIPSSGAPHHRRVTRLSIMPACRTWFP